MANSVLARAESGNLERTKRRYSLTAAECSLEEIAEAWGVSRERVRVIEANALRKLRKAFLADPALRLEAESMGLVGEDEPTPQVDEQLTFGDVFFEQIEPGYMADPVLRCLVEARVGIAHGKELPNRV